MLDCFDVRGCVAWGCDLSLNDYGGWGRSRINWSGDGVNWGGSRCCSCLIIVGFLRTVLIMIALWFFDFTVDPFVIKMFHFMSPQILMMAPFVSQ